MKKINRYGDVTYHYVGDEFHRVGLPAIYYCNSSGAWSRSYYFNNNFHKMNGSSRKNDNQKVIYCILYNTKVKINTEKLVI